MLRDNCEKLSQNNYIPNPPPRFVRLDMIAMGILLIFIGLLFLPNLLGWLDLFHDDMAMDEFPRHFYLSVYLQKGIIPLWEPVTWCGAIPFYARYYMDTYYLPLWPFYLLSNTSNMTDSYYVLSFLPLLLHYWLAAIGMYLFSRRAIRLHAPGAFIASWVYLFSPAFSYKYVALPIVAVQAWLPWVLILVVSIDKKKGVLKVLALGAILAMIFFAAATINAGFTFLLCGLLSLALAVRRYRSGEKTGSFRGPIQLIIAVVIAGILAAVYILPVLDGMKSTEQHIDFTYEKMTGGDGSMPPVYLSTLLIPDLFGTVSGFNNRNWVDSVTQGVRFWDANMSGGILLTFLVLTGILSVFKRNSTNHLRFWIYLSMGIFIFAILCMLGRHSPFYYLYYKVVPVLSDFPFPIRYSIFQVIAMSWLAGIAMESLISIRNENKVYSARLVWGYLGATILVVLISLAGYRGISGLLRGSYILPGLAEIINRGNLAWFITLPILYFLLAGFLLVLAWRGLKGRRRAIAVAILVMMETGFFAFSAFYFCIFRFHEPQPQQMRSSGPDTHPMIERILGPLTGFRGNSDLRWATDQPFHDNFSRLDPSGSFALMGYDMKPLERRFKMALEMAYQRKVDWPLYWKYPQPVYPSFLSNMSVGYLLDSRPENIFRGGKTVKLESSPNFHLHFNEDALPRAFTMDRIVKSSEEDALGELVKGDLRMAVFIEDGKRLAVSGNEATVMITDYGSFNRDYKFTDPASRIPQPAAIKHFNELQSVNPIQKLDLTNPNRIEANIAVTKPAMLVMTEIWYPGWEATVDGKPVELYRVNYLQRGIWLAQGNHRIEMSFEPRAWQVGVIISLISWGAVILISLVWIIRKAVLPDTHNKA